MRIVDTYWWGTIFNADPCYSANQALNGNQQVIWSSESLLISADFIDQRALWYISVVRMGIFALRCT